MKKRVVVLGKGTLAVRVADWFRQSADWDLSEVVPVMPEPTWTDSLAGWAKSAGVSCVESGHFQDVAGIDAHGQPIDLAFSVFYDRIVKDWFIRKCKRILNLHNGPLPKYRGVSPINWALKNNESAHGVTIHEITPGIDDGPVVAQLTYSIYPEFDEVVDVYNRSIEYGWALFQQTIPLLDKITPKAQDESVATYYHARQNSLLGDRRGFTRADSVRAAAQQGAAVGAR